MTARMRPAGDRHILFVVAAVQLVQVVDLMIALPLGPDVASGLGFSSTYLGWVAAAYAIAAALGGLLAGATLDRLDRRRTLVGILVGLAVATAAAGLARDLWTIIVARAIAGAFGGPAMALTYAIIADVVAPERRGKAVGVVMGAFSIATVIGVPLGLELARIGGWRLVFVAVAALALAVMVAALALLPPLVGHLTSERGPRRTLAAIAWTPGARAALLATGALMAANYAVLPYLSAYLQHNLGCPRDRVGLLYGAGGVVIFFAMRAAGAIVDRRGAILAASIGTAILGIILFAGLVTPGLPAILVVVGYMLGSSARQVALNTTTTQIAPPAERGRFLGVVAATQHLAAAAGAFIASELLGASASGDGPLVGISRIAWFAIALTITLPLSIARIESARRAATVTGPDAAAYQGAAR